MATPLVLLHGFTNTGASWNEVLARLPERYRAIAPDLRGHGTASGRRPVDLAAVIDDIAGLVPGNGRFDLVGYSMGGRLALHIALALGDRVSNLLLIGASPGLADPAERAARRAADDALADEIEQMTIEQFAARWALTPLLADQPPDVRRRVDADRRRNTPAGLAAALRGLGTGVLPSLWDRLPQLQVPTTLIVGALDDKFRQIAARMAGQLPQSETRVVSGASHAVHLEDPAAVAEIIASTTG